ncbi:hypothetical protein MKW98_006396 [Papaver atlanticum]|uniref:FAD-binding PCMH-type domain-containing protein n=1 Tax=Papaver atlanticum TaxID=357466 RepID=A0AAD4RVP1_9MAGN|nr:hypothetical protein MKW98_006396 [Papaver atlanticum]
MVTSRFSKLLVSVIFSFLFISFSFGTSSSVHGGFLHCLSHHSKTSIPVYTSNNSNYSSILESTISNLRFNSCTTRKPNLIITPLCESHVQAAVICSRKRGIQIRVRSGGHDFEGLSYTSDAPFIIVDLFKLRAINVNVKNRVVWVQSGATVGELYYRIAEKSPSLGFPAAFCTTVGVGGFLSGGGYGSMFRKYGLAADNVIDARIVDVRGKILDRRSMGKDLFWAIRGGGGGSFGIVLSWKIRLVDVPPTVTLCSVKKSQEDGATKIVQKWQDVAHKLPQEVFLDVDLTVVNATGNNKTLLASFNSVYLGAVEKFRIVMKERFPELGLETKDCIEMSWIQSVLFLSGYPLNVALEVLLNQTQPKTFFKIKSDYVKEPISEIGLEGLWERLLIEELTFLTFIPYGGRMSEISESASPFPHRSGNLFKIIYLVSWDEKQDHASEKYISGVRNLYKYMTPYVSKSPREAYINYRDLDLGQNSKNGKASYSQASTWGRKYFKNNYKRLVRVKSKTDPDNFFRHEQSIPSIAY